MAALFDASPILEDLRVQNDISRGRGTSPIRFASDGADRQVFTCRNLLKR